MDEIKTDTPTIPEVIQGLRSRAEPGKVILADDFQKIVNLLEDMRLRLDRIEADIRFLRGPSFQ